MSILIAIILGALVGWIASAIMGRDEGIIASIVIGVVGSIIGSFISMLFTGSDQSALALSWSSLLWSLVGAVILVAIMNAFSGRRHINRV